MAEQAEDTQNAEGTRDEALGDGGKRALEAERAARKEAEKLAKQWESQYQQLESKAKQSGAERDEELSELKAKFDELAGERDGLKRDLWVRDVAAENDFPLGLADRLRGDTEEELIEDMKKFQSVSRRPAPVPEAGSRSNARMTVSDQFGDAMERLFNR